VGFLGTMATSAALEDRVVNEAKRLCNAGLDQRTLLREVAECLRRSVPSEAFCLSATDPSSELVTHAVAGGYGGLKGGRLFFEHIYLESDVSGYDGMSERWGKPVMHLFEATGGRLEHSLRYRELTGPLGLGFEVRGACMVGRERWGDRADQGAGRCGLRRPRGRATASRRPAPGRRPEGIRAPFAGRSRPTRRR
jgi:hypothetical protein